ncbi:MAG TPA: hypothetical protein VN838_07560 [Bradyrhizobium sp.]|nr:hypothetical protein [Bradyrhizobium sp.]
MIVLVGPLLFIVLGVIAVQAKRRGHSGGEVALIVVAGTACIVVVMFGILAWGFSDFG